MRKHLRTILRILDGAPANPNKPRQRQRGQSLMEMAFITPLLAIMFAGIVEVGWYANHFLVFVEVTRVGARSAAVLSGTFDPLNWFEDASIHPRIQVAQMGRDSAAQSVSDAAAARDCENIDGFYEFLTCLMMSTTDPLEIREDPDTSIDDIVISLFSLQSLNNADAGDPTDPHYASPTTNPGLYRRTIDFSNPPGNAPVVTRYPAGRQVVVVGRYPYSANECTVKADDSLIDPGTDPGLYEHDPFDYLTDGQRNWVVQNGRTLFMELDQGETFAPIWADIGKEYQRGYSLYGQHRIQTPGLLCWGSEWSSAEIEDLVNVHTFIQPEYADPVPDPGTNPVGYAEYLDSQVQRGFIPSQGMILVETYWRHEQLLRFPLFRPIINPFLNENCPTRQADNSIVLEPCVVINVWSAFPLPSVEPRITYRLLN